jgi:hypothetical protein
VDQFFNGLLNAAWEACKADAAAVALASEASREELLSTYRLRAEHLKKFDSKHAREMREDTVALCAALADAKPYRCRIWFFRLPEGRGLVFFETDQVLLG